MASEKTVAIVLRVIDFSETSCVVTLFSRDFGKVAALAKGARRPKSAFESALDLLAVCRIVFLHKSSEALDLLTEAKLERRFRAATRDLARLYAGYYVAELLQQFTDLGDPHPELYDEADWALSALDQEGDVEKTILRFEVALLRLLGYLPSLDACVACGTSVAAAGRVFFGQLAGGVLCPACRSGQKQVVSLSGRVLEILQQLAAASDRGGDAAADGSDFGNIKIDPRSRGELRGLMNHYLVNLLGHPLRMHKFLGILAG